MGLALSIQVGIRPDRRARGMLHISGGGSELGVGQSGRGRWNVPPTWGNAGRGNVKNGGIWGRWSTRGTLGARVLILEFFSSILGGIGRPFGCLKGLGGSTLAIFRPRGRHFAAPGRHPRHHAEKTCILVAWRYQKVKFLQGAGSEYIY